MGKEKIMSTKKQSLKESFVFIVWSYLIGLMSQLFIFPLVGVNISFMDNIGIAIYFTVVNFSLNYLVKRYYSKG
jgi:hypothetical protein